MELDSLRRDVELGFAASSVVQGLSIGVVIIVSSSVLNSRSTGTVLVLLARLHSDASLSLMGELNLFFSHLTLLLLFFGLLEEMVATLTLLCSRSTNNEQREQSEEDTAADLEEIIAAITAHVIALWVRVSAESRPLKVQAVKSSDARSKHTCVFSCAQEHKAVHDEDADHCDRHEGDVVSALELRVLKHDPEKVASQNGEGNDQ